MSNVKLIPQQPVLSSEEQKLRMERVAYFETNDAELFAQERPLDVRPVYEEFAEDYSAAYEKYCEKRIVLKGVIVKIGPDINGKPSIELSDSAGGRCYALFIFPDESAVSTVSVGDTVACTGNLLRAREPFGAVLKKCEVTERFR